MRRIETLLIAFVALQHLGFLILEMFFWSEPLGIRVFGLDPEYAVESASLAANQGLYNGFLAAGLVWSLIATEDRFGKRIFFLGCVIVAGVFGAATASPSILLIQALPAATALAVVGFSHRNAS